MSIKYKVIAAQAGPQHKFLSSSADVVVYGGGAGGGKASCYSAKIVTPSGYTTMEELSVGSVICNPDGTTQNVLAIYEQGLQQIYKLTFNDGSETRVTGDHLWVSWRASKQGKKLERLSREGVKQDPYTLFPGNAEIKTTGGLADWIKRGYHPLIPVCKPIQHTTPKGRWYLPDPYMLGFLLGDGCITTKAISYARHQDDDSVDDYFRGLGFDISHADLGKGQSVRIRGNKAKDELVDYLEEQSLLGTCSSTKFIPKKLLNLSIAYRERLLQGLMDTDGTIDDRGHLSYTTTSKQLADDITQLVQSLGGWTTTSQATGKYKKPDGTIVRCQEAYTLYIRLSNEITPFTLERKAVRVIPNKGRLYRTVVSVEPDGFELARCITVSNPNRLYLTDSYIVTHNTYAVLMDILRYMDDPGYTAVVFRRTSPMMTAPGSIWQTAKSMWTLPGIGGQAREKDTSFEFPSKANVKFSHMELVQDKHNWAGSQLTGVYFDEGQHFEEEQVTFMFSRMRSDANCPSYMRITCNPDPDCFLRRWIDWYLDENGFPVKERGGVLRYFIVRDDNMLWGDTQEEILAQHGQGMDSVELAELRSEIMSFTFIPALVTDNPAVMKSNPKYVAYLKGLPRIEREALLEGCWDVKAEAGLYFKREWLGTPYERPPGKFKSQLVRYWDRAGTIPNESNKNPDYTVGVLMGQDAEGFIWILHIDRFRDTPFGVKEKIRQRAALDKQSWGNVRQVLEQDPGAAGKSEASSLSRALLDDRFDCRVRRVTKDKLTRFMPFSAAAEGGHIKILKGLWNDAFFKEGENYTGPKTADGKKFTGKDDQIDGVSGGYNEIKEFLFMAAGFTLPIMSKENSFLLA